MQRFKKGKKAETRAQKSYSEGRMSVCAKTHPMSLENFQHDITENALGGEGLERFGRNILCMRFREKRCFKKQKNRRYSKRNRAY